jgi:hypothetical protein
LVEAKQLLADRFARVLAKICFNYLACRWGASAALMARFNEIRQFIRHGGQQPAWLK